MRKLMKSFVSYYITYEDQETGTFTANRVGFGADSNNELRELFLRVQLCKLCTTYLLQKNTSREHFTKAPSDRFKGFRTCGVHFFFLSIYLFKNTIGCRSLYFIFLAKNTAGFGVVWGPLEEPELRENVTGWTSLSRDKYECNEVTDGLSLQHHKKR